MDHSIPLMTDTSTFGAMRSPLGKWTVYNLTVPVQKLGDLMRPAPLAIPAQHVQRGYDRRHAMEQAKFIAENADWQFPPITLSCSADEITFHPRPDDPNGQMGLIEFSASASSLTEILDGQHRRGAIEMILNGTLKPKQHREQALRNLRGRSMEVRVIITKSPTQSRRVFEWMQRSRPLTASERVLLNSGSPLDTAAQYLVSEHSEVKKYRQTPFMWYVKPLAYADGSKQGHRILSTDPYWLDASYIRNLLRARMGASTPCSKVLSKAEQDLPLSRWLDIGSQLLSDELPLMRSEWEAALSVTHKQEADQYRFRIRDERKESVVWLHAYAVAAVMLLAREEPVRGLASVTQAFRTVNFDRKTCDPGLVRVTMSNIGNEIRSGVSPAHAMTLVRCLRRLMWS